MNSVSDEVKSEYRYSVRYSSELVSLIDGEKNAYDIKRFLDAQHRMETGMKDIVNYLEVLKAAGLVTFK